ncbi:hypothetical protein OF897_04075 [Chryseobacterium formosus]|uniref:Uncharacterized protein n=1 Tax=Chryseobacterium formosus TaxID=1537363 RepID=A0ABT3XLU1_9FLAO|nr:hypothetical protein [Chryseobacterium formosus]MCX8523098.1 hypothetical protein [Chryseobacterium formosus]
MRGITIPIGFTDIETLNAFYARFEAKALLICEKYNVPELWKYAVINKDSINLELSIISLGSYVSGSPTEKAANDILYTFEEMCNN